MHFRKAIPNDAEAIRDVAISLSRKEAEKAGATIEELSATGFLLYPLEATSDANPNYEERIRGSKHFWVAEVDGKVVAFVMAYTFAEMKQFQNLTENDAALIEFFTNVCGFEADVVYSAQVGCLAEHQRSGVMQGLAEHAIDATNNVPAIITEIAQKPLRNVASSKFVLQSMGMKMVATRPKDDGARVSGTFMRTL